MDDKNKIQEKKKECPSEDAWVTLLIIIILCATFLWATRMWIDATMAHDLIQAQLLRGSEIDPESVFLHN